MHALNMSETDTHVAGTCTCGKFSASIRNDPNGRHSPESTIRRLHGAHLHAVGWTLLPRFPI